MSELLVIAVGERQRHRDTTGLYMSDREHHQLHNDRDREP